MAEPEKWCLMKHDKIELKLKEIVARDYSILNTRMDGIVENVTTKLNGMIALQEANIRSVKTALNKSETELDNKFQHVNKLREEVLEDRRMMVTIDKYESKMEEINGFMIEAREKLNTLMIDYGKKTTTATWVSVGALGISILSLLANIIITYIAMPKELP